MQVLDLDSFDELSWLRAGILTLMVVVLVCTNLRLILENFMKYGWLFNPMQWMAVVKISGEIYWLTPACRPLHNADSFDWTSVREVDKIGSSAL